MFKRKLVKLYTLTGKLRKRQSGQPFCLHSLLNVQSNPTIRSSDIITLQRPSVLLCLKETHRSFTHHTPVLWNSLSNQLWQPLLPQSLRTTTDSTPLLALSSHQFHSKVKPFSLINSFLLSLFAPTLVGSLAP